jgi:hypothetical protein
VLLTACGNRRESRCPPGAAVDRADAFQLVRAGLDGGKGVPASIAGHPRLFVTFTAPGFGPVPACQQRRGKRRPCRPRDRDKRWPHGRRVGCWVRHRPDDPALGSPLCLDCLTPRAWSWGTRWPPSSGGAPPSPAPGAGRRGRRHPGRARSDRPGRLRQGGRGPGPRGHPRPCRHPPGHRSTQRRPQPGRGVAGAVRRRPAHPGRHGRRHPSLRALPGRG